ncbi:hypothetical protein [Vulgatibacter incomptus]|uniref:Menaquinone via futalosine step 2 n=1 Tax=Vulgatibacter incomptus TaxID=1391653 RepID=A0A0K1P8L2_9BACT|nr:hypothetical protein [Vulgatibacter incomptus]AKU89860.1 Menaquinone via futalosine step 2 [Vulgatibacter incomptus]
MKTLLVCAAVKEELDALLPLLEADEAGWSGSIGGVGVLARTLGVGPVEAALGAAAALAERPVSGAILVGTCGAFPGSGLGIGSVAVIERSLLTSSDAGAGLAYVPGPAAGLARSSPALIEALSMGGLPRVGCATVVAITRDGDHAAALGRASGCEVEHLEAHGFLRAAERAGVPAACLLGVANDVGPLGHEQWKRHAREASAAAVAALERVLPGLAPYRV